MPDDLDFFWPAIHRRARGELGANSRASLRVMDGPFFVVERGNALHVLLDKREVEYELEAIDVRNGEYRVFTSDGTELQLAADDERVVVRDTKLGHSPEDLERAVRKHLRALPPQRETISKADIDSASLADLTRAALRAHTAIALGRRKEIRLRVAMPARKALDRLSSRVARAWPGAGAIGDLSQSGYVGEFGDTRFRIREKSPVPRYYALQAFGSVSAENGSAVLTVRFRRQLWASIVLWALRILWILLLVGAIISSTQQAAFYPFVVLVAVVGGVFLWTARERKSDREGLHKFIIDSFPGAVELPLPEARLHRLG